MDLTKARWNSIKKEGKTKCVCLLNSSNSHLKIPGVLFYIKQLYRTPARIDLSVIKLFIRDNALQFHFSALKLVLLASFCSIALLCMTHKTNRRTWNTLEISFKKRTNEIRVYIISCWKNIQPLDQIFCVTFSCNFQSNFSLARMKHYWHFVMCCDEARLI